MGCCGSKSTYGVDPGQIPNAVATLRSKYGSDVLIMGIKDQNQPGKMCLSGPVDDNLIQAIHQVFLEDPDNKSVKRGKDAYDQMWEANWHETHLTSGYQMFSLAKKYFPKGKLLIKLFDAIAAQGWSLAAAPNFGGVEARDDKGNVTSCVDWPVFIFYRDPDSIYTNEHLLFAIKDSNVPGKLCAAGPVGDMEAVMTSRLQAFAPSVKSEKDEYDNDYDVVWRNTSITTGHSLMSFAKSYFPKGKTNVVILNCAYSFGWRAVAAPNFGGQGDSWPCVMFRKLKDTSAPPPEILFGSIKDSNVPGKFCLAGASADQMVDVLCGALAQVQDNGYVKNEKDSYDEDYDAVCRNVHITTGMAAFSFKLPYFPRGDSMSMILNALAAEGFQVACCPNFGGMLDSWPTFIFERRDGGVPPQMYLAVKDNNIPGKIGLVGGGIEQDPTLQGELLEVLQQLCGPDVVAAHDDYDRSFNLSFKNTRITSGHATFTMAKPYWPHGYVVEMILQVLLKHGWRCEGGPNFGDDGLTWPGMIFSKAA